jgi:uncharacterized membrane protein
MNLMTSKYLGGVGALLLFIGVIPGISTYGILAFAGLVMVLAAVYGLAGVYKEQGIFNNAILGTAIGIGGVVAIGVVVFFTLIDLLKAIIPGWNGDWTALQNVNPADISANITFQTIQPFITSFLIALLLLFVVAIAVAFFFRRSFILVANKTGTSLFGTTGLLILIGAIFTIILIGLLLIWIAMLLLAVAFFTIRTQAPLPQQAPMQQTTAV